MCAYSGSSLHNVWHIRTDITYIAKCGSGIDKGDHDRHIHTVVGSTYCGYSGSGIDKGDHDRHIYTGTTFFGVPCGNSGSVFGATRGYKGT